jgi:hypothetical protein
VSAKPRRVKDPARNFAVAPAPREGVDLAELLARVRADPTEVQRLAPAVQLALWRVLLIALQLQRNPAGLPSLNAPKAKAVKTRGRPRSAAPAKMLAEYNFDVEHLEAFRELGYGNVPPNKAALDALVKRLFPNDPSNKTRLTTVKKTLQRERARQRR